VGWVYFCPRYVWGGGGGGGARPPPRAPPPPRPAHPSPLSSLVSIFLSPRTQALLGEGGNAVLEGQRALPARLAESGFTFKHPRADAAVRHLFR